MDHGDRAERATYLSDRTDHTAECLVVCFDITIVRGVAGVAVAAATAALVAPSSATAARADLQVDRPVVLAVAVRPVDCSTADSLISFAHIIIAKWHGCVRGVPAAVPRVVRQAVRTAEAQVVRAVEVRAAAGAEAATTVA